MRTKRLLIPFTHGVDMYALEHAVHLAKNYEAGIVAASLISRTKESRKAIRLEKIQQSRDFEVALSNKSSSYGVSLRFIEVVTRDAIYEINYLVQEHECEGIVLFVRKGQGVLLQMREIKRLMLEATGKLYIVHLPVGEGRRALQDMIKDCIFHLVKRRKRDSENGEPIALPNVPENAGEQYLLPACYGEH